MAETVLAFGLAVNVMTFIDFSYKIFSNGYQLHLSSRYSVRKNQDLEIITKDLHRLTDNLEKSLQQGSLNEDPSLDEVELQRLAEQCKVICLELVQTLQDLQAHGSNRKWNTFLAALKTVWKEEKIEALQKTINQFRQQLIIHMLGSFR